MAVEFIGFITNNNSSETIVRTGPVLDPPYIETVAKAHESGRLRSRAAGVSLHHARCLQVAQHVLQITESLKVMIAQRPGFTAPTLLARQLATLDQFYGGRVSLHVITGGNAAECVRTATPSTTRTSVTPAPTSSSSGPGRMEQRETVFI